jgi:hypothetical protein
MKDYDELLDTVTKMDNQTAKRTVSYVSVDIGTGHPLVPSPKSYTELLSEASGSDITAQQRDRQRPSRFQVSMPRQFQQQPKPHQAPPPEQFQQAPQTGVQEPQPQKHSVFSTITSRFTPPSPAPSATVEPSAPMQSPEPTLSQQVPAPLPPEPTVQPVKPPQPLVEAAADELSKVVVGMPAAPAPQPQQVQASPTTEGLILPTLSLSDQISELDKIIDNLRASNFNSEQMSIVRAEVTGLSKVVSSQESSAAGGLESDLQNLRKIRVAQALSLMGGH